MTTAAQCETPLSSGERTPRPPAPAALIERLARVIAPTHQRTDALDALVRETRARALALAEGSSAEEDGAFVAAVCFVADLLGSLALERPPRKQEADEAIRAIAGATGVSEGLARSAISGRALRDPRLLELPPALALEAHLRLFIALAPVTAASVWVRDSGNRLARVHGAGGTESPRTRSAARAVLTLSSCHDNPGDGAVVGVPILRSRTPVAALVVELVGAQKTVGLAVAREAAIALGPLLEQEETLARRVDRERALVEASERRLARLAFDIHDGPTQTALALGLDVALLRAQLDELLPPGNAHTIAVGRMHDLGARLAALQEELRELSNSLEPATIARKPLRDALTEQVEAFARETDIATALALSGDFAAVTPSQRIALVRIVQEALANVRQHSGARSVSVSVEMRRGHLHAEVTDDGCGFDVERTLVDAARNGRLGLVGMGERVRLLDGRFSVQSRADGPTTISVAFPLWRPALPVREPALELRPAPDLAATRA